MGDIRDTVLRIKKHLDALMAIQGFPEVRTKEALKRLLGGSHSETDDPETDSSEGSPEISWEELEQRIAKLEPEEAEQARKTLKALGILSPLENARSEEALDKLDEEFIHMDRYIIHEYSDPDDKEMFQAFMSKYDGYRNIVETYDPSYFINELTAGTVHENDASLWFDSVSNWMQLAPAFVLSGSKISKRTKELYAESRKCFVFGNYLAVIVMCRAVFENILKEKFKLDKNDKQWTAGKVLNKALSTHQITTDTFDLLIELKKKADDILHKAAGTTVKDALDAIVTTRDIIELLHSKSTRTNGKISSN